MSLRRKFVNGSLKDKKCPRCGVTYPRNEDFFYAKKHRTIKNAKEYDHLCIRCRNENTKKYNKTRDRRKENLAYRQSERGYLMQKWNSVKKSNKKCMIKSFDEFLECWEKQKEEYGEYCPYYPHIKLTRILGKGKKGRIDTNLSVDRLANSLPYTKDNIMFVSWRANDEKGDISPYLAEKIVDLLYSKDKLRMFIEMDTYQRNGQKFSFEKYHQKLAEEREEEIRRKELHERVKKSIEKSEEVMKKSELILQKSREQTKLMKEKYDLE